jgi:glycosyltransferase involved in cell wall biosynthesis
MSQTITVVQSLAGAPFGGAENYYTRMVCALAEKAELSQHAFTRPNDHRVPQFVAAGVPVQKFRFGGKFDLLDHWAYRKALKKLSPDIVLTYMNRASQLTPKGDYQHISRLGHYYDLKYHRHADYWIGISLGICDHLIKGGMPADRVFHIPNFADESEAQPVPRDSFNTAMDKPLLLAAGRLHTNKGFDVLLHSLAKIDDAILWLAGDGPEEQALKRLCDELKLTDRVRFLGWRNDVASLMETADMFICPSRHEGLGSIVAESWFHHCPIIATMSQGPGELIDNNETGLLTPIDDVDALANAIKQLLETPDFATKLADNAHRHYLKNYRKSVIVEQYTELFHKVMNRPYKPLEENPAND